MATYSFNGMDLRVVEIDGEPWFVATDVCKALTIANATYATRNLNEVEVQRIHQGTFHPMKGGAPVIMITESGLYKLVMRSDKAQAKEFQDWVTREVLPTFRKTGARHARRAEDYRGGAARCRYSEAGRRGVSQHPIHHHS